MMAVPTIYLWEYAPSPHLGNVLKAMADRGNPARYVVHSDAYESRTREGWTQPEFPGVDILQVRGRDRIREVIAGSGSDDVHICVGLRGNEFVRAVSAEFRTARRPFWLFMETVNERRWWSVLKRPLYRWLFARNSAQLEVVLAAGETTPGWVAARGLPEARLFDFAYFLRGHEIASAQVRHIDDVFRLLFVGSLVPRKRVHLIVDALAELPAHVVLDVVGDGPLRADLTAQAEALAPGRVTFHGTRPMPDIAGFMAGADCLVLPSDHDGWGAVVSEAMMEGTRVICSDRCGASVAVRASGVGRVFEAFAEGACSAALKAEVASGVADPTERAALADWAHYLTDTAGAAYLEAIIAHVRNGAPRPTPPWKDTGRPKEIPE